MAAKGIRKNKKKTQITWKEINRQKVLIFWAAVFVIYGFIFCYLPLGGWLMAFQNYKPKDGLLHSQFVGLAKFQQLFSDATFLRVIRNTLAMGIINLVFTFVMAIVFAILLNEVRSRSGKKVVQTISYLPHFLSWVVLASVVVNLFSLDGSVNQLLAGFGMDKINFLGSNQTFQGLIIGTDIWKEFGYSSVVYLAAITSIDPGLHEAAAIDGASWWKRVWNVTIPGMLPIILLMAAMNLTGILSAGFDQIYNLYSPIVYETGDVLDTYVYRIGLVGRQYSFGAAVGLCRSAVGMILLLTANGVTKKMTGQKIF